MVCMPVCTADSGLSACLCLGSFFKKVPALYHTPVALAL